MRKFDVKPAVRERVPLWLGLFGAPGSGKTYSALRLATGIARETGQSIAVVDTEARRALHYADYFRFQHLDMAPPFGSLDYLAAVQHCVKIGHGIIVIDSTSHEHEGPGGYLDTHEKELDAIAGDDHSRRAAANWRAYAKPAAHRKEMVNRLSQINAHILLCFRAQEKMAQEPDPGKPGRSRLVDKGWQPISGTQLLYSMTVNLYLPPNSQGRPQLDSPNEHERRMMKMPEQFKGLFSDGRSLDEEHGAALAQWAAGGKVRQVADVTAPAGHAATGSPSEHAGAPADKSPGTDWTDEDMRCEIILAEAAGSGTAELARVWGTLSRNMKARHKDKLDSTYKVIASRIDAANHEDARAHAQS